MIASSTPAEREALRCIAFHGSPRDALLVVQAARRRGRLLDPESRWLSAVCLGAVGRYGQARDELAAVTDEHWRSQALSTRASHRRQVGDHAGARELDQAALRAAMSDGDVCDALTGLAADSVGAADARGATEFLAEATAGPLDWRRSVRSQWVRAEVALLDGRPGDGVLAAGDAVALSEGQSAPRHAAKSLMVLGVCLVGAAGVRTARPVLQRAHDEAVRLGAWTLVWPTAGVLAETAAALGEERERRRLAAESVAVHATIDRGDP